MQHNETTLSCGLRVIHESSNSPVLYCGYVVCAGTRDEALADIGMAHFIEHMTFKGTERRTAQQVINQLEIVGGELNAFTTKQETVYHATVLKENFTRAANLLTDIVFHSTYPQSEIDREVDVICDEIDSYKDSPSELIFDEFEAMMYPSQPLGRDILGRADRLRQYTTADALRFTHRYYRPENAVFFVYGDVKFSTVVSNLERQLPSSDFASLPPFVPREPQVPKPQMLSKFYRVKRGTYQAHVVVGGPTFAGTDDRRYALALLNNILGGPGMNSRLNLSLREKHGLVYSVDSYLNTYPDTGYWNVYFGCDENDCLNCLKLLRHELDRLIEKPLKAGPLSAAKQQLCGQIGISTDSFEAYALALGKTFAHYNRHRSVPAIIEAIQKVTAEEIQQVAQAVYRRERLITLMYV